MTIDKKITEDNTLYLSVTGRLDVETSPQFREYVSDLPKEQEKLVLDLKDMEYMSSAGLRELLVFRKRYAGSDIRIVNVTQEIMDIFSMTGYNSMFEIEVAKGDISTYLKQSLKGILGKKKKENPDGIFLKGDHDVYSYKDVDMASQIIAGDLAKAGVKRGSHVGLCGSNSINWVLTFFAIQKLGAMAMLINPSQKPEEIGRTASIGDITFLCYGQIRDLGDADVFRSAVTDVQDNTITGFYDFEAQNYKDRYAEYEMISGDFGEQTEPDSPCTVLFTSGSTGKPKGVLLSSYNMLNAARVQVRMLRVTDKDKLLLIVPLFHILGLVVCLLPCVLTNAVLYIPDDIRTDTLIRVMEEEHCTLLHSVPTMINAIMNNKKFDPEAFKELRCSFLAGAAATEAQMKMFRENLPNNHFVIAYGLSEMAPVSVTLYEDTVEHITGTVGKPVENITVKIVDHETGKECGVNEAGEILVQGFNLMTGYYKIPFEDQAIDEEGYLHTGDMGYLTEEGYLCMSGRYKELIIRGGENIMPGEVEAAISEIPEIESVKVVSVPSAFFGEEVCACIKFKQNSSLTTDEMKEALSGKLAKYKIPSYFLVFDELPVLGSGKVDGVALREKAIATIAKWS